LAGSILILDFSGKPVAQENSQTCLPHENLPENSTPLPEIIVEF
jgi:hypothetical protein